MIRMAFYRASAGNIMDWVIALCTWSRYSHIEVVFDRPDQGLDRAFCFSASPRDGGTRYTTIDLTDCRKWEVIPLPWLDEKAAQAFCDKQMNCKYDWWGVIAYVIPWLKPSATKWFCSEVGTDVVQDQQYSAPKRSSKMSPEDLMEWVVTEPVQFISESGIAD